MHSTFQVFRSFELHIFNYFACTIYTSNILAVQLTVHIATLLMHLLPVSESGWISTSSRATIVDSCITFTVCWTATSSNITLYVGSDTVGSARVVVSTSLVTFSNMQTEIGGSASLIMQPFMTCHHEVLSVFISGLIKSSHYIHAILLKIVRDRGYFVVFCFFVR